MSRDLVFEIGVEEIPSGPLYAAVTQLKELAAKALKDARLESSDIRRARPPKPPSPPRATPRPPRWASPAARASPSGT